MSVKTVRVGMIGLGARGETLLATIRELDPTEVKVTAVCDLNPERVKFTEELFRKHQLEVPKTFTTPLDLLDCPDVDAVLVPTSWNSHLQIAAEAMKRGIYAGIEVGGASSIDELWQLVHASESTGVSCMMLENCCYGRDELMVLNMVRMGLFGELIHCECGYEHDLSEMARGDNRKERALHNLRRNGDLYPTHGIGPVAKILKINRGNRFVSLTSTASKARGFAAAAKRYGMPDQVYNAGDIINTVIKCANGETICITHGVSLPRPYSRNCRVQGTNGIWLENANGIYIEGISPKRQELDVAGNPYDVHEWNKPEDFYEKYDHPIWKDFSKNQIGGHGGMDALSLRAFFDAVRRKAVPPIDVYDCATWMAVTSLSEQSIALGSAPVYFPDFTNGKWIEEDWHEEPCYWSLN